MSEAITKVEDQAPAMRDVPQAANGGVHTPPFNSESEIQLVSSLAKLQELERKIHELRHVMPTKLLEPLAFLSKVKGPSGPSFADSPAQLRNALDQSARTQLATIENFKSMWQGAELKPVWAHVESRVQESNGQVLQPTGMWERDYDVLLEDLVRAEESKNEERLQDEEETQRAKAQFSESHWQETIERFSQGRYPGASVITGRESLSFTAVLSRAGMGFHIKPLKDADASGITDWQISIMLVGSRPPTKIENAILDCLNSRSRKWDLAFLLDMISSYADFKQTKCVKCNNLANRSAQLPILRRARSTQPSQDEPYTFAFDALHASCA